VGRVPPRCLVVGEVTIASTDVVRPPDPQTSEAPVWEMFLPGVVEGVEHPVLPTARLRPTRGVPAAG